MKDFLDDVITPNQSAFFPNRLMKDNIFIAHEAFHFLKMKRKSKSYGLGVKLDMNKAHDRIEWDFLE